MEAVLIDKESKINSAGPDAEDTLTRMSRLTTEIKQPGQDKVSNFSPEEKKEGEEPKKNNAGPSNNKRENITWKSNKSDFEDDDDEDEPTDTNTAVQIAEEKKPKFTAASKAASARIFVRAFDTTQKLTFTLVQQKRLKKKFTTKEVNIVDKYEDIDRTTITDKNELKTLSKWDKIMKRHDQKIKAIPLTPEEKEDLKQMLMDYQDIQQELLSPAWGIALSIGDILIGRTIDVFTD